MLMRHDKVEPRTHELCALFTALSTPRRPSGVRGINGRARVSGVKRRHCTNGGSARGVGYFDRLSLTRITPRTIDVALMSQQSLVFQRDPTLRTHKLTSRITRWVENNARGIGPCTSIRSQCAPTLNPTSWKNTTQTGGKPHRNTDTGRDNIGDQLRFAYLSI